MNNMHRIALAAVAAALGLTFCRRRKFSLDGKVVVITGGSRGLGLAMARELASQGARLALIARDEAELERAAIELRAGGTEVSIWPLDLMRKGSEEVVAQITEHHGGFDVLINNAGEIVVGPFETFTEADFERSIDVHLMAPLRLTQAVLPIFKRQGSGRIVNISSIGGKIAVPHLSAYCAGKFALVGLSGTLRAELAKDDIVVTTVCPGLMRTGSHWNAKFKGEREGEFAWFAHGASMPFVSMDAQRAARQIITAMRRGNAEVVISLQAQMAVVSQAIAPAVVAAAEAMVNRLLPPAPTHGGQAAREGWNSRSDKAPSILTKLGDRAAERNNELRGHTPPAEG